MILGPTDLESFSDLFFRVGILHLPGHHGQELYNYKIWLEHL